MCGPGGDESCLGEPSVKVGVVDIGTNSMRLLITDGLVEDGRWVEITGLGREVDATGRFSAESTEKTLRVLRHYGRLMDEADVSRRMAIATSASRDASNRERFFTQAEKAIGVRPELISGDREGLLAFAGATAGLDVADPVVVSDIGGGSTEFVTRDSGLSVDIGSVRLTERYLPDRPPERGQLKAAIDHIGVLFAEIDHDEVATHIGVAGTWTSLAAIAQDLARYERRLVHGYVLSSQRLGEVVEKLRKLTVAETAAIPSLDPKRAPVILAGAIVAVVAGETLGVAETLISERDTLDGAAMELLSIP